MSRYPQDETAPGPVQQANTPMDVTEFAKQGCEIHRAVPAYWSDWFGHAADILAVLYEWRGEASGDDVRTWLHRVIEATGHSNMVGLIEYRLSQRPKAGEK